MILGIFSLYLSYGKVSFLSVLPSRWAHSKMFSNLRAFHCFLKLNRSTFQREKSHPWIEFKFYLKYKQGRLLCSVKVNSGIFGLRAVDCHF